MKNFNFIDNLDTYKDNDSFIAIISSEINNKESLFKELGQKLKFPDYFGQNWDALDDCLKDFHWIKEKKIILVHNTLPRLEEEVFKTYIDILDEAIQTWEKDDVHQFEVVFPKASEASLKYFTH